MRSTKSEIRTVLVALGVLLILISGCIGNPQKAAERARPDTIAPGVTNEGIASIQTLVNTHQNQLIKRGFVVEVNISEKQGDSSRDERRTYTVSQGAQKSYIRFVERRDSGTRTTAMWTEGNTTVVRQVANGLIRYQSSRQGQSERSLTGTGQLSNYLESANFEVVNKETDANGNRLITLTATVSQGKSAANATMELVVSSTGIIHSFALNQPTSGGTFSVDYTVQRIGNVSPQEPDWTSEVPENIGLRALFEVDVVEDSYLRIEHTDGREVPAGTFVNLVSNGAQYTTTL
ncbi:MAG: hypothetical protein SXQ77_08755, partial [Halobacteria archaeon]|nr:hypothetical protein [Halobacteria archaeon]